MKELSLFDFWRLTDPKFYAKMIESIAKTRQEIRDELPEYDIDSIESYIWSQGVIGHLTRLGEDDDYYYATMCDYEEGKEEAHEFRKQEYIKWARKDKLNKIIKTLK